MPPVVKFNKEIVIDKAIELIKNEGEEKLSARNLASYLNSSVKPIFSLFKGMDELRVEVIKEIENRYYRYLDSKMEGAKLPYKAVGLAYIEYARTEPKLFKLLFMRNRKNEEIDEEMERKRIDSIINVIMNITSLSYNDAYILHLRMWIFVHGIAVMIATGYLEWDLELISMLLTKQFESLKR